MSIFENISLAVASLRANKMRALLTMLGIIIGIGSVIAIITLGDSLTGSIAGSMQSLGANNLTISLQAKKDTGPNPGGSMGSIAEKNLITDAMLDDLRETYPDEIEAISLSDTVGSGQTTAGKKYANLSLVGVTTDYTTANSLTMLQGRFVNARDEEGTKKVAVVSDKLVANMFGKQDPLGQQITITAGGHVGVYTIVGVYQHTTNAMGMGGATSSDKDISTNVYIPLSTAGKITKTSGYQSLTLVTTTGTNAANFQEDIYSFFDKYYSRNTSYGISIFSMESMLETMTDMLGTVQIAIAAIAAISLLVGGIGVMNIMMVSITERTREIGTRKAIGATNGEIRLQFIVEAVIICLVGGIIGIALGIALGALGAGLLGTPATVSPSTMLLASGFSMAIGVFFGYYPANKAAKLDPIDALRYE